MEVKVVNLYKKYGHVTAVNGINFSISSGQIVGFIGPNGAGKTTTIKMLATLQEPTSGDILFDRVSITEEPELARRLVGYMPDALPTHRDTTIHDYLDFFARAYGLRGAERRQVVEQVEAFTQVDSIRDKVLFSLSKGMKQRVSLARALLHDPKFLILDEPAAGLDPRARIELRELLKILAEQGKAILLSSHILSELSELCSHAIFIEKGKVLRSGLIEALQQQPLAGSDGVEAHSVSRPKPWELPSGDALDSVDAAPSQRTFLLIRTLRGEGGLLDLLPGLPHIEHVRAVGRFVEAEVSGGDQSCHALLQELMRREIPIVEFHQQNNRLEELFLQITEGQVQ